MTPTILRPVPRLMHLGAILTVILAVVLLAFGGFVTSFRVGMADPVWPTEPWYLANNYKADFGYLVEHTHRILGFVVGGAVSLLAIAIWWTEPNKKLKWIGLAAIIALLAGYGEFHRGMGQAWNELKTLAASELGVDAKAANFESQVADSRIVEKVKSWPTLAGAITALFAIGVILCGVLAGTSGAFGGWLRCCTLVSLVAIMVQGLLGGFRVFFNALAGSNLAAIHGAFGQIAFCVLIAVMVLAAPRRAGDTLNDDNRESFSKLAWFLVGLLTLQLLFAVMLRHGGSALSQRLHILTAFAVTGLIVWLVVRVATTPEPRFLHGIMTWHLAALLIVQVTLGVESYIGKFAASGPQAQVLPEARPVTRRQAAIRTLHQLVGCGLLASAVAVALRMSRQPTVLTYESLLAEKEVPPVAAMAFHLQSDAVSEARPPDVATMALKPPEGGLLR